MTLELEDEGEGPGGPGRGGGTGHSRSKETLPLARALHLQRPVPHGAAPPLRHTLGQQGNLVVQTVSAHPEPSRVQPDRVVPVLRDGEAVVQQQPLRARSAVRVVQLRP